MTTSKKGVITELKIKTILMQNGFIISTPEEDARYDLIADYKGKLIKIQVKSAAKHHNRVKYSIIFNTSSCKRLSKSIKNLPYRKNEIDYFATIYEDNAYFIPIEETGTHEFSLRIKEPKSKFHKNKQNHHPIEDYSLDKFIKRIKEK